MFKKILFLSALITVYISAQSIGPRVTIPQIHFDYSQVPENSTFQHTYVIYNGGGGELKLSGVTSSCKCISANLDKSHITEGDSARLVVNYTNNGKAKGLDDYVTIKTNDPSNPDVKIYITRVMPTNDPTYSTMPKDSGINKVTGPVIYLPETEHDFGKMKQGDVAKYTFKIINKGTENLRIRDITTSCGCTAAVVDNKDIPAGKEGEILVQFDSAGKMGRLSRKITVFSNDPKTTYKYITIFADVETGKE